MKISEGVWEKCAYIMYVHTYMYNIHIGQVVTCAFQDTTILQAVLSTNVRIPAVIDAN